MTICPIANAVGCKNCGIVNFCLLKSVFGNYEEEEPGQESGESSSEPKSPDT